MYTNMTRSCSEVDVFHESSMSAMVWSLQLIPPEQNPDTFPTTIVF
jgi:hypothetical protein